MIRPRRFIPAGAGNSRRRDPQSRRHAVYPRWRGELCFSAGLTRCDNGLSPLARGTLFLSQLNSADSRFIPAGAGNSCPDSRLFCRPPVYPRWRGELVLTDKTVLRFVGLSPLARGTRMIPNLGYRTSRFIPAGAGNSDLKIASQYWRAVYPRWRGELSAVNAGAVTGGGLSPLARGTHRGFQ